MKSRTPKSVVSPQRDANPFIDLPRDTLAALDDWIAAQPEPKPARAEVIRYALRDWLIGNGFMSSDRGSHPTKLSTETQIAQLEEKVAQLRVDGPPSPQKGMAKLKRGVAKLRLKGLKATK